MRYFLDIAYNGTNYHGWQEQQNANSVQAELNKGLSKILGVPMKCVGSGRTDTGVHARQQIVHFDCEELSDQDLFQYRLNSVLPKDISVRKTSLVSSSAHARFDACKRTYHYLIHQTKDPFKEKLSYFFSTKVDTEEISKAGEIFKKQTDFESFSKVKTEVNTFHCEILELEWLEVSEGYIFKVSANRFLRGMVRAMVGTLLDIGTGKLSYADLPLILDQKDRRHAGRSVPPHGLYLTEVAYPDHIYLS